MTDLNSVSLGGRVTKDAVLTKLQNGTSMAQVSIAVNRSVKGKDSDEWTDKPTFIDFPLFGKYAESMAKWLKKGSYITVHGHLEMDSWKDENGKTHQKLKVVPEIGGINPWISGQKKESPMAASGNSETNEPQFNEFPEETEEFNTFEG